MKGFNTQPPEGGWFNQDGRAVFFDDVSTHSRPKAAGSRPFINRAQARFQHTAARRRLGLPWRAGRRRMSRFNTQPPEGGW